MLKRRDVEEKHTRQAEYAAKVCMCSNEAFLGPEMVLIISF